MQKMNIWFFSAHDQPRGRSSRTYDFCKELVKLGHQVSMFTNSYCHWTHEDHLAKNEKWRVEYIDGIRVVWLRTYHYKGNGLGRGVNMLSNMKRCYQASKALTDKPDVIIGPSVPIGTGWMARKIAKTKSAAFVFEIRDVWPIALVDDGSLSKSNPLYFIFRSIEKKLYKKANRISATMPFVFDHVKDSGGDPKKVKWIPNGVSFGRFDGYDSYDGGKQDKIVAMYVGGFGAAHDVITVVKAATELQKQGVNNIQFIIIGDGPKKQTCVNTAKKNGLTNIEFRDPIPKADIPKVQMDADILMACVLDSDAYRFGLNLNKIFDYFASARPVIFSGNTPNDPINESGAGFSIPPEDPKSLVDALKTYIGFSPTKRQKIGRLGQKYVKQEFDMAILGGKMETLLLEAVNSRKN